MRSAKEMPASMKEAMKKYLDTHDLTNGIQPEKFMKMMATHHAFMDIRHIDEEDWLELKNPLIVVLGDSITASYFETVSWNPFCCAQCPQDGYAEKFDPSHILMGKKHIHA